MELAARQRRPTPNLGGMRCRAAPGHDRIDPRLGSGWFALRRVRIPSVPRLGLDVRETGARGRIGNADEMVAGRTLNLPARVARVALQGLVTMGTIEFELGGVHRLQPHYAQTGPKKYIEEFFILFPGRMRM